MACLSPSSLAAGGANRSIVFFSREARASDILRVRSESRIRESKGRSVMKKVSSGARSSGGGEPVDPVSTPPPSSASGPLGSVLLPGLAIGFHSLPPPRRLQLLTVVSSVFHGSWSVHQHLGAAMMARRLLLSSGVFARSRSAGSSAQRHLRVGAASSAAVAGRPTLASRGLSAEAGGDEEPRWVRADSVLRLSLQRPKLLVFVDYMYFNRVTP